MLGPNNSFKNIFQCTDCGNLVRLLAFNILSQSVKPQSYRDTCQFVLDEPVAVPQPAVSGSASRTPAATTGSGGVQSSWAVGIQEQ